MPEIPHIGEGHGEPGRGLTRPALGVLLANATTTLYEDLLPSDLPDDPQLLDDLVHSFPAALTERYSEAITIVRWGHSRLSQIGIYRHMEKPSSPTYKIIRRNGSGCAVRIDTPNKKPVIVSGFQTDREA
jgi:hypothetical protein